MLRLEVVMSETEKNGFCQYALRTLLLIICCITQYFLVNLQSISMLFENR